MLSVMGNTCAVQVSAQLVDAQEPLGMYRTQFQSMIRPGQLTLSRKQYS